MVSIVRKSVFMADIRGHILGSFLLFSCYSVRHFFCRNNVFSIIPFYLCPPFCVNNNLFNSKQKIPNSNAKETEENHGSMAFLSRWLDYPIFHQISRIFHLYHQLRFLECRNRHHIKVIQELLWTVKWLLPLDKTIKNRVLLIPP